MSHIDDNQTQRANLKYIGSSMKEPLLEREHELDLARKWREKGDERALHELVRSYTRLVVSIASKFKSYGLPLGDLIQEGNIGLMEAAARFEPARENRFSTYATWWIRASIQDYVLRNWSIVRTGTTAAQKSLFFNLRRLRAQIEGQAVKDNLDEDGIQQIANELGVKKKEVRKMEMRMMSGDQSLNNTITGETENEWIDFLEADDPNPEDIVVGMRNSDTRSKWLSDAVGQLNPREQTIIKERRLGEDVVTLETLGKELGISKERVRQLEQRALDKIRDSMLAKMKDANMDSVSLF
jgi:RNA polymerase sigma-32 factor